MCDCDDGAECARAARRVVTITYGSFARRAQKVYQDVLACANQVGGVCCLQGALADYMMSPDWIMSCLDLSCSSDQ